MHKVVFLCKGTVGDVRPLLAIAFGYKWVEKAVLYLACIYYSILSAS